ncbi:MAG: 5'/3'-nucleotidase SurE [Anaerolineaceae bacterium]|nr:5'/3'-nucleotidase SurE [Anaerolineaceae bacterium]
MSETMPRILITNDDGIQSPGLAAVAAAVHDLGEILLVAPQEQQTSMSRARSQFGQHFGKYYKHSVQHKEKSWHGIGIQCTPALCVNYAIDEISPGPVDLVISGINYGENIGTCVTVSGTIGAAIEAADRGIPAIAVSLELNSTDYHSFDQAIDFQAAMAFTRQFTIKALAGDFPDDVDILKIEVPVDATPQTQWVLTRQDRIRYYAPHFIPRNDPYQQKAEITHTPQKKQFISENTDAHAAAQGLVSVTPLSINLTSRTDFQQLEQILH